VVIHYNHHRDDLGRCREEEKNVCRFEKAGAKGFLFILHAFDANNLCSTQRQMIFSFFNKKLKFLLKILLKDSSEKINEY
jgi:hypothetical protein